MPGEGAYQRAGLGIPHSHRAIVTPTCQGAANRTERYACDLSRMPGEGAYVCTRGDIPQPDGVPTRTCNSVSIGTERYACDPIRMPGEGA